MKISKGKWWLEFKFHDWQIVVFNWEWPRWEFGYENTWYDGPHKSFTIGPFNVYWNF